MFSEIEYIAYSDRKYTFTANGLTTTNGLGYVYLLDVDAVPSKIIYSN